MLSSGRVRHFDEMEVDWGESFRTGGKEFAAAIAHGTQPDMDVQMAREVFAFQLAALRSDREGREGREVSLSEIPLAAPIGKFLVEKRGKCEP